MLHTIGSGWMDFAAILLVVAAMAVGITSAVVRTWALHRRVYSLEDRCNVLEGVQQREVKIRAAESRARRPSAAEESIALAMAHPPPSVPVRRQPWWKNPQIKARANA